MANQSIDGVFVQLASATQLATYTMSEQQLNAFKVPALYDASNPNVRVYFALFDGTGN